MQEELNAVVKLITVSNFLRERTRVVMQVLSQKDLDPKSVAINEKYKAKYTDFLVRVEQSILNGLQLMYKDKEPEPQLEIKKEGNVIEFPTKP